MSFMFFDAELYGASALSDVHLATFTGDLIQGVTGGMCETLGECSLC